ncbi:dihydropteroate synthase-like protein [Methanococcus maripaludis]|jgi:dihydropteroate synthase-like protein|uniref:Dihydropteroate synthase-related protein n=3 Tax=Methanococcus maripaludis TaxID=39152 RepID=G0H3D5_METMI|nr:dihydropteroate synthase-like protein [Methanococcus maripaludis]AEK20604.1 dihydropteroate synthase-related protein [Methanococcus maripaludis X1]BAP61927.1 putative dihydropteroate synthase [Methanococcus maripaludis KA1]BAP63778.1 putative dihydropteroate synthase [Methanococcus maripaludis OS7]
MKILVITGKQAFNKVSFAIKNYEFIDVYEANISIAAFLTPNLIIKEIKKLESSKNKKLSEIYDFVLVTGLIRHDLARIYEETGIKCFKSTREASDIPVLIKNMEKITLSTVDYADSQIAKFIRENAQKDIENAEKLPLTSGNIKIGNLKVGNAYPMRVLGEIVHVPWLSKKELEEKVNYYVESGADMIDLGMVSNEDYSKDLKQIIKTVRDITDKPVSVDTLNTKELIEAINLDVDMILSVDSGNFDELLPHLKEKNTVSVVLPTNYKTNEVPENISEKIQNMEKILEKFKENELTAVADPILEPINNSGCNFTESVIACYEFKKRNNIPMFFGIGNVTELFDVDSNGVNASIAAIGQEIGGNILFTPEASQKCKFSIKELKTASKMLFLAKMRNSLPKDVGYDLINYKDKKFDEEFDLEDVKIIEAVENEKQLLDRGSFKIRVDRRNKEIIATYYIKNQPKLIIKGNTPKKIYETALRENLITKMDHAAYFGKELRNAELALKLGKKYNQDFDLFYNEFWNQ